MCVLVCLSSEVQTSARHISSSHVPSNMPLGGSLGGLAAHPHTKFLGGAIVQFLRKTGLNQKIRTQISPKPEVAKGSNLAGRCGRRRPATVRDLLGLAPKGAPQEFLKILCLSSEVQTSARRQLAGPIGIRFRSFSNLSWHSQGVSARKNFRPRLLPVWPREGQKVKISAPAGGGNWLPFLLIFQT